MTTKAQYMMSNQGGRVNASDGIRYDNANFNSSKFNHTIINVTKDDNFLVKELMSDILAIMAFYGVVFSMFNALKKSVGVENWKLYQHYGTFIVVVGGFIVCIMILLKCYFSIKNGSTASASSHVESPQYDLNHVSKKEERGDGNAVSHVESGGETNAQPNRKQPSWMEQMKWRSLYCKIMFLITPIILYILIGVLFLLYFLTPSSQPQPQDASQPSIGTLMVFAISAYILLTIALIL